MIHFNRRTFLISCIIFLILLGALFLLGFNRSTPRIPTYPTPSPTATFYPSGGVVPTSVSSSLQTGADVDSMKQYLSTHPDLAVEADLRVSVPIKGDGFTIDFSYKKDKFIVTIFQPRTTNYDNFLSWFKSKGLKQLTDFEFVYQ